MREPGRVEPAADRPDHAVHHAARGDHVGPGLRVADALLGQERQRGVVVHVEPAAALAQDAAVAVVGVLAEALVGDEQHVVAERLAQRAQRLLHDARRRRRALDPVGVLVRRGCRRG